jgi:hypothetical protein
MSIRCARSRRGRICNSSRRNSSLSFSPTVGPWTLNGTNGFRLDGVAAGDTSGSSVAGAGDVNGDGFADVIVGAPWAHPHGSYSGSSYVVFGKASGFAASINLSSLNGTNGFRLDGVAADNWSGRGVAGAGDVNGDGFADVMIGRRGAGLTYVVFGKASGFASIIDLSTIDGGNGFGINRTGFPASVAGAGDVNGDGFADVIVGSPGDSPHGGNSGSSYVVFGKASGFAATIRVSKLDGTNGFRLDGTAVSDLSGSSVASAGDVNGDGFADVIVGADGAPNATYAGSSFIIFGRAPDTARTRIGAAAGQYISGGTFGDTLRGLGGRDALQAGAALTI